MFPSNKKLQNWIEIQFLRNIWGQLDVRTTMRAPKSRNFDLEKLKLSFWRGCRAQNGQTQMEKEAVRRLGAHANESKHL